ncbi:Ephrin type-A receptor 1 [Holothuria leucospilota]|uniref:Ephrin type-A receptor 1 n=1 Tax=Holothuria leucospilota TaxID=206669 RepID=A0A9Q0YKP6_HOLLE|nr:Ephrin type-A receptor 1 [Holothuria leucospilota]
MKEGSIYTRWMGTISLSGEEKKCVVITSVTDTALKTVKIYWDAYIRRVLELPPCKHLAGVEGVCIDTGISFHARISLINEHIVCGTLDLHVRAFNMSHVPMSASEVNCHLLGILEGMALIHSYGFLHPGLSSNKILLTNQGVCKLYDFCLSDNARNILEYKMSRKTLSLNQFPPEAIQRNDYSQKSDVWSTAVVIWEILSNGILNKKINKFLT